MLHKESAANRLPGQRSGLSSERRNSDARLCRDTQRSQNHAVYDSQRDHPTGVKSASDSLESASAEAHYGERTQLTPPRRSCCRRQAGRVAGKAKSRVGVLVAFKEDGPPGLKAPRRAGLTLHIELIHTREVDRRSGVNARVRRGRDGSRKPITVKPESSIKASNACTRVRRRYARVYRAIHRAQRRAYYTEHAPCRSGYLGPTPVATDYFRSATWISRVTRGAAVMSVCASNLLAR